MAAEDDDDGIGEFLAEAREDLDRAEQGLLRLEAQPDEHGTVDEIFRILHTLKSSCGFLEFHSMERLAHQSEGLLSRVRAGELRVDSDVVGTLLRVVDVQRQALQQVEQSGEEGTLDEQQLLDSIARLGGGSPTADPDAGAKEPAVATEADAVDEDNEQDAESGTLPIAAPLLSRLMDLVGELVQARNALQLAALAAPRTGSFEPTAQQLDRLTTALHESVLKTRMQPVQEAWQAAPRLVRDLCAGSGKAVRLQFEGGDTQLDRALMDALRRALTSLVRRSVEHGVESRTQRLEAGKQGEATLCIRASRRGAKVVVEVEDDGRRQPVANALDAAGFADVRRAMQSVRGHVDVERVDGRTRVRLTLPLTLAILSALVVRCELGRYAIPQDTVVELLIAGPSALPIERVHGAEVVRRRGRLLPVLRLREVLQLPPDSPLDDSERPVVVLDTGQVQFGLLVDQVEDSFDLVVKELDARLRALGVYSGATVFGDGKVALILDPQGVWHRGHGAATSLHEPVEEAPAPGPSQGVGLEVLVAELGDGTPIAVAATDVLRVERLARTELVGHLARKVPHPSTGLPRLVLLEQRLGAREVGSEVAGEFAEVIVCRCPPHDVGIVVAHVLDVTRCSGPVRKLASDGVTQGSAIIDGRVTAVLHLPGLVAELPRRAG